MSKRQSLTLEELANDNQKVFAALVEESDIACVLIGASYLSELLATVLKEAFIETSLAGRLLSPRGIVGAFVSRAELAYCLGLIKKESYQEISRIADIRNLFAHRHLSLTFSDESVVEMCNDLQEWRSYADLWGLELRPTVPERARDQFIFSVSQIDQDILLDALNRKSKKAESLSKKSGEP